MESKENCVTTGHDSLNHPSLFPLPLCNSLCFYPPTPFFPRSQDLEHQTLICLSFFSAAVSVCACVRVQCFVCVYLYTRRSSMLGRGQFDCVWVHHCACLYECVRAPFSKLIPEEEVWFSFSRCAPSLSLSVSTVIITRSLLSSPALILFLLFLLWLLV